MVQKLALYEDGVLDSLQLLSSSSLPGATRALCSWKASLGARFLIRLRHGPCSPRVWDSARASHPPPLTVAVPPSRPVEVAYSGQSPVPAPSLPGNSTFP